MLKFVFFRSAGGNEPVRDWLSTLSVPDRKAVGIDLRTVQAGWPVGMPVCRPLGDGLYEVRTAISDRRTVRVLFLLSGNTLVALHGFVKKTQKTPDKELAVARQRQSDYLRSLQS